MNKTIFKMLIAALAASMMLCMASCGKDDTKDTADTDNVETTTTSPSESGDQTTIDGTNVTPEQTTAKEEDDRIVVAPNVGENTYGYKVWQEFVKLKDGDPDISAVDVANGIISNGELIQFMGAAMNVDPPVEGEEAYFSGFGDYRIEGFESGATFAPMMGSIAFVGYIFDMPDGADIDAFVENLRSNADPRWNICVTADQVVIGTYNNTVFFLMCPEA